MTDRPPQQVTLLQLIYAIVQRLQRDNIVDLHHQALLRSLDIAYIRVDIEAYMRTLAQLLANSSQERNEQSAQQASLMQRLTDAYLSVLNATVPPQTDAAEWYLRADKASSLLALRSRSSLVSVTRRVLVAQQHSQAMGEHTVKPLRILHQYNKLRQLPAHHVSLLARPWCTRQIGRQHNAAGAFTLLQLGVT